MRAYTTGTCMPPYMACRVYNCPVRLAVRLLQHFGASENVPSPAKDLLLLANSINSAHEKSSSRFSSSAPGIEAENCSIFALGQVVAIELDGISCNEIWIRPAQITLCGYSLNKSARQGICASVSLFIEISKILKT